VKLGGKAYEFRHYFQTKRIFFSEMFAPKWTQLVSGSAFGVLEVPHLAGTF